MLNYNSLAFEYTVLKDIEKLEGEHMHTWNNFSNKVHSILTNLCKDSSIIIKPADEGGAIVIQNNEYYC